jgi:hypothetical protein
MFRIFSFSYLFKATKVFLSYPRAIPKLAGGMER